jgi:hypothetical protein
VHPFRAAVEAHDIDAAVAVLTDDVVLNSPITFKPYVGKPTVGVVLAAVAETFQDFVYEAELSSADGSEHALMFRARVGDRELQGCDFLHHDSDGKVDRLTVMVRPLSAALALRDEMAARLAAAGR